MAVSKATVINALTIFKGLQDEFNAGKFALKTDLDNVITGVTVDGVAQTVKSLSWKFFYF